MNIHPKGYNMYESRNFSSVIEKTISYTIIKGQSHFLVPTDKLDRVMRRIIAPYAQIVRKEQKCSGEEVSYLDINRFNVFLADEVDLNSLLYETAMVIKTITNSTGVFLYIVNKPQNEIIFLPQNEKNPPRHEVNIPIEEGRTAAAHVAATKEYLLLDDVTSDLRFADGFKWIDARAALCMPIVKPDGDVYAVLELYRNYPEPYDKQVVTMVTTVAMWAGAAAHQAQVRITLKKRVHLNTELRSLLHQYFSDLASIDTMLNDMLAVVKQFLGAMRSSFFIIDKEGPDPGNTDIFADVWDDSWSKDKTNMPKKLAKVNLTKDRTPAGLTARTAESLNIADAYKDPRFNKEIDPTTGVVVRSCLTAPILGKDGIIGVVTLTNKLNEQPFDKADEDIFEVFVKYSELIIHFYNMKLQHDFHENLNYVYGDLTKLHLVACKDELDALLENNGLVIAPLNFRSYNFDILDGHAEDMASLALYMCNQTFVDDKIELARLADFIVTVLQCYRRKNNPYHNAQHGFRSTHTVFLIVVDNPGRFDHIETTGLILAALCHALEHPGSSNSSLALAGHSLAAMYEDSAMEHHHLFMAKSLIDDHQLLANLPTDVQDKIMEELKYNIISTDFAVYCQIRHQLQGLVATKTFDWKNAAHRRMAKGLVMAAGDLTWACKPFMVAKEIAGQLYEEMYNQGDKERSLGFKPLTACDRHQPATNQPSQQIEYLSSIVQPCMEVLQRICPEASQLMDGCLKNQVAWREEIEIQGHRLWTQDESVVSPSALVGLRIQEGIH